MVLNKFIPTSPDENIREDSDMATAKFGHLNTLVNAINSIDTSGGGGLDFESNGYSFITTASPSFILPGSAPAIEIIGNQTNQQESYLYNNGLVVRSSANAFSTGTYSSSQLQIYQDFNVFGQNRTYNASFGGQGVAIFGSGQSVSQARFNEREISAFNGSTGLSFNWNGFSGDLQISGVVIENAGSDAKLKDNVIEIPNALDKVKAIKGVEFDWNELAKEHISAEGRDVGVIAQDVEAVYPIAVRKFNRDTIDKTISHLVVDYDKLHPLALQAIRELSNIVDELKLEVKTLKTQINGNNI